MYIGRSGLGFGCVQKPSPNDPKPNPKDMFLAFFQSPRKEKDLGRGAYGAGLKG